MKKFLFLIAIVACQSAYCQKTDFWFTQKYENADWYQERLLNIDGYMASTGNSLDSVFAICTGAYDILVFERYVYGESIWGGYTFVHHAILVKTDKAKQIVEAYFVPYGWAEYPIGTMIYKSDGGINLKNGLDVKALKFRHLDESNVRDLLKEHPGKLRVPKGSH